MRDNKAWTPLLFIPGIVMFLVLTDMKVEQVGCTSYLVFGLLVLAVFVFASILSKRTRYEKYKPPVVTRQTKDRAGRPVFYVSASSAADAGKVVEGWTYPGEVSWVVTHLSYGKWMVHVEDWKK